MAKQMDPRKETSEWQTAPSKYTGLGAAMAAELMIGCWFGIGVVLYCIHTKMLSCLKSGVEFDMNDILYELKNLRHF